MADEPDRLNHPPLPPLTWDTYFWTGKVKLPSWAGFQTRRGGYGSVSSRKKSDGSAVLFVAPVDRKARTHPTPEQEAALRHLVDYEAAVAEAVAHGLADYCPGEAYDGDDETLLNATGPGDLRPLVGLSTVHVLDVFRDGAAYIGFEFGCAWDDEHGAGVLTHLGRVVAAGQADTSFLEWIAERDKRKQK